MRLKMMGGGDAIDYDALTAKAEDVPEGLVFIGADTEDEQTGTLPDMEKMQDSPGYSENEPNIPVHYATEVGATVDTNGNPQIVMAPPLGKYPGEEKAWVGCYPADLGILAEIIAAGHAIGNTQGIYGADSNLTEKDLRAGKIGYGADGRVVGGATDFGDVVKTIAAGEAYIINEGYYGAGKVTAKTLASQTVANALAVYILENYSAWVNGNLVDGEMPDLSNRSSLTHASGNGTKVILGDAAFLSENSDGVKRVQIRYNGASGYLRGNTLLAVTQSVMASAIGLTAAKLAAGVSVLSITGSYKGQGNAGTGDVLSGKRFSTVSLNNASGTMPNNGAKTASLNPGGSYTIQKGYHNGLGKITAKNRYVKQLHACAVRGFDAAASDYETGMSESFTVPAAGTVYYNGFSACNGGNRRGEAICEIYKNGKVVDSRNIDGSNSFVWRGTMYRKSFSVAAGDVVQVNARVPWGSDVVATIDATIIYFQ